MIQEISVRLAMSDSNNTSIRCFSEAAITNPDQSHLEDNTLRLFQQCLKRLSEDGRSENRDRQPGSNRSHTPRLATEKQIRAIELMARKQGFDLRRYLADNAGASSLKALTIREASTLIDRLKEQQQNS